jgi:hypothetical protein
MGERHESSGSPRAAQAAGAVRSRHPGNNPQVRRMNCRPAFHDPSATVGRDMVECAGPTSGLEVVGEVFGPAANIVLGQAGTARKPSRPSSSQHLAGS